MRSRYPRHVLVADNDPDVLASVQFSLAMAGFEAFCAESESKAREILLHEIVHVAVIDIRLQDDNRSEDSSGFELARELPPYIPCVIYTAYENTETLRRTLSEVHAKASVPKDAPGAAAKLCEEVEKLFAQYVKTNFALQIDSELAPAAIATKIELPEAERAAGLTPTTDDVTQILRTLFCDAQSINVTSLLPVEQAPSLSQAGSLVALVTPRLTHGWGASKIVKFGARADIEQEALRYEMFKDYPHGQRMPRLDNTAYSRQIGGLTYSLIDGSGSGQVLQVFAQYYQDQEAKDVIAVLEPFFRQTFGTLYRDAQHSYLDIPNAYASSLNLTPEKLRLALCELRPDEPTAPRLHFADLAVSYPNPYLYAIRDGHFLSFHRLVRTCLCHGDLHGRNLLVDHEKHFWLIDFARVEVSHALRDFAELESDIKFSLLQLTDLSMLLEFEQNLLHPRDFTQRPPRLVCAHKPLAKAYAVILALRRLAFDLVRPEKDMQEYYQAVFMHTLKVLRLRHIERGKKEHALLSAALLCERLDFWPEPPTWLKTPFRERTAKGGSESALNPDDGGSRPTAGKRAPVLGQSVHSREQQEQGTAKEHGETRTDSLCNYEDFQVLITPERRIRASSKYGDVWGEFRLVRGAIEPTLNQIEQERTDTDMLRNLGSMLFQALFRSTIHGLWSATCGGAYAQGRSVRLRLGFSAAGLATLPWEFLYDENTNTYLACDTRTVLSRYIDVAQVRRDLSTERRPLRLLLVVADPATRAQLAAAEEETLIRKALASHIAEGIVEVDGLQQPTMHNLSHQVHAKPYDVLHFIGHGDFQNDQGSIALIDDNNNERLVDDQTFADLFLVKNEFGLVVLNSCRSASSSVCRALTGVAPHLVQRGVPAVVAMQHAVRDTTSVQFADVFYGALAEGWPLDTAVQIARNSILLEVGNDQPDFAAPVLFMRAKDGVLL